MSLAPEMPPVRARRTAFLPSGDWLVALLLLPPILVILAIICPLLLLVQGRPLFHVSERMRTPTEAFRLLKLRTMTVHRALPESVLGGGECMRITRLGHLLRTFRIDELPQIFNVLRGDLKFIGPRPPLRRYVAAFPAIYREVLRQPPGITGLATVRFHALEARILRACATAEEADRAYREKCVPAKARLDRLYRKKRSPGLDFMILYWTFSRLAPAGSKSLPQTRPKIAASQKASEPSTV